MKRFGENFKPADRFGPYFFRRRRGAQSICTIALDTYPAGAAQNVIVLFSRMELDQLLIGLLFCGGIDSLSRDDSAHVCLDFAGYVAEEGIVYMKPLSRTGTFGASTEALVLTILSIGGLILSLWGKGYKNHSGRDL